MTLKRLPSAFVRVQRHPSVFSIRDRGQRTYFSAPSNTRLTIRSFQLEGDLLLFLHEPNRFREAQFPASGGCREWRFRKDRKRASARLPAATVFPQVCLYSRMHGGESKRLSVTSSCSWLFGVDWFAIPPRSRFRRLQVQDRLGEYHSRAPLPLLRKVRIAPGHASSTTLKTASFPRHVTIRTLLLRLLETGLKSSSNEQLFITSLRTSGDGQTRHRGAAIGLVFERLIEEGRKALFPPTKPKVSSTIETVTTEASNASTSRTKSPPSGSSNGGCSGSGTTKLSSVKESSKSKKSGGKKYKLGKRYHSPPCVCEICKRARKGPERP